MFTELAQLGHYFIETPAPCQEGERSCIYVLGVSMWPLSIILLLDLGAVCSFVDGFVKQFY
jgi:hypothetical protein